jgi:hypothetical protein
MALMIREVGKRPAIRRARSYHELMVTPSNT